MSNSLPIRLLMPLLVLVPACGSASGGPEEAAAPVLAAQPPRLVFSATVGGTDPAAQRVIVANTGAGRLAWQATEGVTWLALAKPAGQAGDGFEVGVAYAGLAAGTHRATIAVTDPTAVNSPLTLPVTLTLRSASPPPCDCPALPAPTAPTTTVSTAAALAEAVRQANANGGKETILLEDGTYDLAEMLHVTASDVTVRGMSGDRDAVTLRGPGMSGGVAHVFLVAGARFTTADLTLGWVRNHGIQVQGEQDADDVLVHNVRFVDTGEQMLKVSYDEATGVSGDRGVVRCCLFEYTAGVGPQYYIGGVDCHHGVDWKIQGNTFRAIRSPEARLAEHAIHFWSDARGTLVENNIILDCDRGIGFGLGASGHVGGLIRNNMVHTTRDVGIGLERAVDVRVVHNSVYAANYPHAIEYRFAETTATIVNNLTYGAITARDGGSATLGVNHQVTSTTDVVFVDPAGGDLHLATTHPQVVDQGEDVADAPYDVDCQERPHGEGRDLGADEWYDP